MPFGNGNDPCTVVSTFGKAARVISFSSFDLYISKKKIPPVLAQKHRSRSFLHSS